MVNETQQLLRFQFAPASLIRDPVRMKPLSEPPDEFLVYTTDPNIMKAFLAQHSFNEECFNEVRPVNPADQERNFEMKYMLEPHKMKSNDSNAVYTVYTTSEIIDAVINQVASELSETLSFGSVIIRDDIEVINLIQDIMNDLQYGFLEEFSIINDDTKLDTVPRFRPMEDEEYVPDMDDLYPYEPPSVYASIVEEMYGDLTTLDNPTPFTVEAYARAFAILMNVDEHD
jgi:hypothetical protein